MALIPLAFTLTLTLCVCCKQSAEDVSCPEAILPEISRPSSASNSHSDSKHASAASAHSVGRCVCLSVGLCSLSVTLAFLKLLIKHLKDPAEKHQPGLVVKGGAVGWLLSFETCQETCFSSQTQT
ncbi:hypothetical protein ILYODFUR_035601 [Ilyodon furcidens]|uniref:Uncharacterized protein n=1 Tax=Ilyodon furcidens TaxID=33524 RepID=A0ABV0T387_9TELE